MKKQLALLLVGLAVVPVAAAELAHAYAGPSPTDIQDSSPFFSSNGVDIAFVRGAAGQTSRVLDMTAGGTSVHVVNDGVLRGWVPGGEHLLVQVDGEHTFLQADSIKDRPLAEYLGVDASASPDGTRVAYLRAGTLYVAAIDGTGERAVAPTVQPPPTDSAGPVWSADGTRIAVAAGASLLVVQADGSGTRTLTTGAANPSWSVDGSTLAFERAGRIWLIRSDGTEERNFATGRLPRFSPVDPNALAYVGNRDGGQYALWIQSTNGGGAQRLVTDVVPGSAPAWSPTAAQIAVAAREECFRAGIYVVRANVGAQAHRLSNRCRFDGTAAAETIGGTQYFDIVNGNGGNDTIYGLGGNDKLSGDNGNDTIFGGAGNDFVFAGPGDDTVYGGAGNDTIIPGNGRDRIDCGPGVDTVEGAGPLDRIAKNCEHVSR